MNNASLVLGLKGRLFCFCKVRNPVGSCIKTDLFGIKINKSCIKINKSCIKIEFHGPNRQISIMQILIMQILYGMSIHNIRNKAFYL